VIKNWGKSVIIDFHVHSRYSFDSMLKPSKIIEVAKRRGLDGVAITDHETIKGGFYAKKINEDQNFVVIMGCEVNTEIGDIIGLFLEEDIQSRNSIEVVREIKEQKGITVLPHPYRGHKLSKELVRSIDLIEGFNSRSNKVENENGMALATKYNKPVVAGSDAHFASEIGLSRTYIEEVSSDLKSSILYNGRSINGRQSPNYVKSASQTIKVIKKKEYDHIPFELINLAQLYCKEKIFK
jgi:predicted metal-dependent phosphoesterase TrpH